MNSQYRYFDYDPKKDRPPTSYSPMLFVVNSEQSTYAIIGGTWDTKGLNKYGSVVELHKHLNSIKQRAREITEDEFTLELLKRGLTFDPTIVR